MGAKAICAVYCGCAFATASTVEQHPGWVVAVCYCLGVASQPWTFRLFDRQQAVVHVSGSRCYLFNYVFLRCLLA
jgi:hypothetical protein